MIGQAMLILLAATNAKIADRDVQRASLTLLNIIIPLSNNFFYIEKEIIPEGYVNMARLG